MRIATLLFFLTFVNHAWSQPPDMLSLERFRELSPEQQFVYIQGLQNVLVDIAETTPFMAELLKSEGRSPAQQSPAPVTTARGDFSIEGVVTSDANKLEKPGSTGGSGVQSLPVAVPPTPSKPTPLPALPSASASAEAAKPATETKTKAHYRCLYAGWVIERHPCQGPRRIPDWLAFDGMKASEKSCSDKNDVVCNPLLFGLWIPKTCRNFVDCPEQAKALCVRSGRRPTWDCRQAAQAENGRLTKVARELITSIVPQQYERFRGMFQDLCGSREQIAENPFVKARPNPKAALDDIDKTCREAERQVAALNEKVEAKSASVGKKGKPQGSSASPARSQSEK
ncbi:MAG: hypothetical protein ACK5Y2_08845 [Bdellovibrionales bacterium]